MTRNALIVVLLLVVTIFSAFTEGYLPMISLPFAVALLGGFVLAFWLASRVTTVRLLALVFSIFSLEYLKETIGLRSGMWVYHGINGQYTFGVWAWVLGGLAACSLATGLVIPLLRRLRLTLPRVVHPVALLVIFALVPLTLGAYRPGAGPLFWSFYALLLVPTLLAAWNMKSPVFAGLVVASWLVGNPSEYVGSASSHAWTFPHNPSYPPFFLLAGCWPLEILAQYSLSALLAGEALSTTSSSSGGAHA